MNRFSPFTPLLRLTQAASNAWNNNPDNTLVKFVDELSERCCNLAKRTFRGVRAVGALPGVVVATTRGIVHTTVAFKDRQISRAQRTYRRTGRALLNVGEGIVDVAEVSLKTTAGMGMIAVLPFRLFYTRYFGQRQDDPQHDRTIIFLRGCRDLKADLSTPLAKKITATTLLIFWGGPIAIKAAPYIASTALSTTVVAGMVQVAGPTPTFGALMISNLIVPFAPWTTAGLGAALTAETIGVPAIKYVGMRTSIGQRIAASPYTPGAVRFAQDCTRNITFKVQKWVDQRCRYAFYSIRASLDVIPDWDLNGVELAEQRNQRLWEQAAINGPQPPPNVPGSIKAFITAWSRGEYSPPVDPIEQARLEESKKYELWALAGTISTIALGAIAHHMQLLPIAIICASGLLATHLIFWVCSEMKENFCLNSINSFFRHKISSSPGQHLANELFDYAFLLKYIYNIPVLKDPISRMVDATLIRCATAGGEIDQEIVRRFLVHRSPILLGLAISAIGVFGIAFRAWQLQYIATPLLLVIGLISYHASLFFINARALFSHPTPETWFNLIAALGLKGIHLGPHCIAALNPPPILQNGEN